MILTKSDTSLELAFFPELVGVMILQSLLGDDLWDDAADAGWSLTSIPLSCWSLRSKLLDLDVLASTWTSVGMTEEHELTMVLPILVEGVLEVTTGECERSECVIGFSQALTDGGGAGDASRKSKWPFNQYN